MTLESIQTLFLIISFLVPGYLCCSILAAIIPQKDESWDFSFFRYLTLSCFNYVIWSWLIYQIIQSNNLSYVNAIHWFLIVFISPLIIGLVMGLMFKRMISNSNSKLLQLFKRAGFLNPIPTAWDYFFSKTKPVWILVTLNDGSLVAGDFNANSFASSGAVEQDLYIESVYIIPDDGSAWRNVINSKGIWIKIKDVKHIEFFDKEEC